MTYVYILQSVKDRERFYVGVAADLRARLKKHNAGEESHTSKYVPWTIKTYIAFSEEKQAFAFERYSSPHQEGPLPKSGFDPERVLAKLGTEVRKALQ